MQWDQHAADGAHWAVTTSSAVSSACADDEECTDTSDGSTAGGGGALLRARSLILATGTYGTPRRLEIPGELPSSVSRPSISRLPPALRSHACRPPTLSRPPSLRAGEADSGRVVHRTASLPEDARTVLVVGAGLSAADCIVHLLRGGKTVVHAWCGAAANTKVGSKVRPAAIP